MAPCRVGKGDGTALPRENPIVRRAHAERIDEMERVGTALRRLRGEAYICEPRLCPPYGFEPVA